MNNTFCLLFFIFVVAALTASTNGHEFCAHDELMPHVQHTQHHERNHVHLKQSSTSSGSPIRFSRVLITETGKDWTCDGNARGLARIGDPPANNQCLENGPPRGDCFLQCSATSFSNEISYIYGTVVPAALDKITRYITLNKPTVGDLDIGDGINPCGYKDPATFDVTQTKFADTDFVLFVTTRPMVNTVLNNAQDFYPDLSRDDKFDPGADRRPFASWTTYAFPCQQSAVDGRPVSGVLNVDPGKISFDRLSNNPVALNQTVDLLVHEMFHALGFSAQYMSKWKTSNSEPAVAWTMEQYTTLNVTTPKNVTYLKSPKVLQAARDHFNCPSLAGAILEDGYVSGFDAVRELGGNDPDNLPFQSNNFDANKNGAWLRGSHFEKRVFGPEFMTAGPRPLGKNVISPLTLAAMEDTGWYTAVSNSAEELEWGRDLGCDFLQRSCADQTCLFEQSKLYKCDPHVSTYWCELDEQCSFDLTSKTTCKTKNWDVKLPEEFRYFRSNPKKGGFDAFMDFCPMPSPKGGDVLASCAQLPSDGSQYIEAKRRGEVIASDSRCFRSSVDLLDPKTTIDTLKHPPACFRTHCLDNKSLKFKLGDLWYTCDASGIRLFFGVQSVFCPKIEVLCRNAPVDTSWPIITDIKPAQAQFDDRAIITINGKNFQSGPGPLIGNSTAGTASRAPSKYNVTFYGIPATNISVVSSTQLTCTLPPITTNNTVDTFGDVRITLLGTDRNDELQNAFKATSAPVPSPTEIVFKDEEGECNGFLCKECLPGVPCWVIPVVILPLILLCVIFNILRKRAKKKKMEKKGRELGDAEEPSIQL